MFKTKTLSDEDGLVHLEGDPDVVRDWIKVRYGIPREDIGKNSTSLEEVKKVQITPEKVKELEIAQTNFKTAQEKLGALMEWK